MQDQAIAAADARMMSSSPVSKPRKRESDARFVTVSEAAAAWNVSTMTVRRAMYADRIPHIKFGRSYWIPRAFVDQTLADLEAGKPFKVDLPEQVA